MMKVFRFGAFRFEFQLGISLGLRLMDLVGIRWDRGNTIDTPIFIVK